MTDLALDTLGLPLSPFNPGDMLRIELNAQFERYGQRPFCCRCRHDCKQYAAPGSIIVYCPRIAKGVGVRVEGA